jgi:hypothetical protein
LLETKTHQRQESRQAPPFVSSKVVTPDGTPRASSDPKKNAPSSGPISNPGPSSTKKS